MKTDGFLTYTEKNLPKVISLRRILSAPDAKLPPILDNGQVLFSPASEVKGEPRSCMNCLFYNYGRSCQLMTNEIEIRKLKWPKNPPKDSKQIEYWPVCGMWTPGEPNYGSEKQIASLDPDNLDLGWVNAPEVGQKAGGTNCGGANGGDDCDYWMTDVDDKRKAKSAFCRVLQRETDNEDCCCCWTDDDWVSWRVAQERLKNG